MRNTGKRIWDRYLIMPPGNLREPALDGIRGLAVTMTFFVHFAGSYLVKYRGGNPAMTIESWTDPFDKVLFWLYQSHHGVHFFFTLSGFLIARMVLGSGNFSYRKFFYKRVLRIYPAFLFWLIVCIALPVIMLDRAWPTAFQFFGNLVFLNAIPQTGVVGLSFNNVTWSLFFEFAFYFSFPFLVYLTRRAGTDATFGILVGGLALAFIPFIWGIFETGVFILFFGGALVGRMNREDAQAVARRIPDVGLIAAYLVATTTHTFGALDGERFLWIFALVSALVVLKAAYGYGLLTRLLSIWPLVWLGEISFSFYLTHSIALAAIFMAAPTLPLTTLQAGFPVAHAVFLGSCGFAASVVLGAASFALFERAYFGDGRKHLTIAPVGSSS